MKSTILVVHVVTDLKSATMVIFDRVPEGTISVFILRKRNLQLEIAEIG